MLRLFKPITAILFFAALTFQSCQREFSLQKSTSLFSDAQLLKIHQSKVETWINLLPIDGNIKTSTSIVTKTINQNGQLVTRMAIGDKGSSLLFISNSKQFHVYGLNTSSLKPNHTGVVEVFDFQSIQKKGLRFSEGKLSAIVKYPNENIFNAYLNQYPIDQYRNSKNSASNSNSTYRTTDGQGPIRILRKFFCELFGGYWAGSVAENATNPSGTCYTSSNGEDVVQNFQSDNIGGGGSVGAGSTYWGLLYSNINDVNFFDFYSQLWANYIAGLNGGSGNFNSAITSPIGFIDQECTNAETIRVLFFTLNTKYNQQPANLEFGPLDETFEEFKNYKNQQEVLIPIIPWLIKAGANGTADALMQALFIYLIEDDCPSFGAAFGHDKFSKTQVARSATEGLILLRTPGGKLGKAAFTAVGDILVNLIDNKYGLNNYQQMGSDFMLGFFGDLAGGAVGDLASKFSIPKLGKGLLTKFGIHYKTVTSWLGGGLQQINKSFVHNGQTITASRVMKGFAENKVVVIGRNMDDRVVPFAQKLSQELGINVVTIKQWSGWNPNLTVEQNKAWLQQLKNEGYTFYDIGLDPSFTSIGNFSEGPFYSMELNEIFR